jgi:hypothetical protein
LLRLGFPLGLFLFQRLKQAVDILDVKNFGNLAGRNLSGD